MRKILFLSFIILTLSACTKQNTISSENDMQIVGLETDSTRYGIFIKAEADSMLLLFENSDSTWIKVRGPVYGSPNAEDQMAVLFMYGSVNEAKNIIDMTQLMGRWVEPDPVNEGMIQGIELQQGGAANSINSRANHYVSWRIYNGNLLLVNTLDGIADQDVPEDTFHIMFLSADSLRVSTTMSKHFFRRSNGGEDDTHVDYDMYESPDALDGGANPEDDVPIGSGTIDDIPENDRVF